MLGSLRNSRNSLKNIQDEFGQTNVTDFPIRISGGDSMRLNDNIYNLNPKIYKALSSTSYTGKDKKSENDILMMNNIIRDLGYTGDGDRDSKRKKFFRKTLSRLVDGIQNKTIHVITDDSDVLQGEGLKIIITSNRIVIYT